MLRMIKTELWKLKRYHILWAGVLLMALSVLLALFSSTAQDGSVWTFPFLVEQVIKNNATTIFPVCITLITRLLPRSAVRQAGGRRTGFRPVRAGLRGADGSR